MCFKESVIDVSVVIYKSDRIFQSIAINIIITDIADSVAIKVVLTGIVGVRAVIFVVRDSITVVIQIKFTFCMKLMQKLELIERFLWGDRFCEAVDILSSDNISLNEEIDFGKWPNACSEPFKSLKSTFGRIKHTILQICSELCSGRRGSGLIFFFFKNFKFCTVENSVFIAIGFLLFKSLFYRSSCNFVVVLYFI